MLDGPNRPRRFTLLLAGLTALTALSIDMSLPALPRLQTVFHADAGAVQGTLSGFLFGYAAGQLVCGPLSDKFGRRPLALCGLAAFILAGLGCALSGSLAVLVALRVAQGVAAGFGAILARAMVRDRYGDQAAAALSQITQIMVLAPLIAPTIGGWVLSRFGWQAIFVTLALAGAGLLAACGRGLPETLPPGQPKTTLATQVKTGFQAVFTEGQSLRYLLVTCATSCGLFAYISGSPLVAMQVFHVSERAFGLAFALPAACLMVGASANRALLKRSAPAVLLRCGAFLLAVAGASLLTLTLLHVGGLAGVLLPMMLFLGGTGLVQPNATALALAPHGRTAGASASVMGCLQTLGGALAGWGVGTFYDHSPRSLAVAVAAAGIAAFALSMAAGRAETRATPVTA